MKESIRKTLDKVIIPLFTVSIISAVIGGFTGSRVLLATFVVSFFLMIVLVIFTEKSEAEMTDEEIKGRVKQHDEELARQGTSYAKEYLSDLSAKARWQQMSLWKKLLWLVLILIIMGVIGLSLG